MSTRSYVAFERENGQIIVSYVHWDGYFSGVGKDLFKDFNNEEKALEVASNGSRPTVYDDPYDEPDNSASEYPNLGAFSDYLAKGTIVDYAYLWRKGKWFATDCNSDSFITWQVLKDILNKSNEDE